VAWRTKKHTGSDALEHYQHVEAADFVNTQYSSKAWCMNAYLDHEAEAIDNYYLSLGTRHSCDGNVLELVFLLLLGDRKKVTTKDCLECVGGYGSMFTTHLCEQDNCTKGGYRAPHFEARGYRCPNHGGVRPDTCTDCEKIGYRGEGHDGYRCTRHGGVYHSTCIDCEKIGCRGEGYDGYRCKHHGGVRPDTFTDCEKIGCRGRGMWWLPLQTPWWQMSAKPNFFAGWQTW
jgi:hypothetical protein